MLATLRGPWLLFPFEHSYYAEVATFDPAKIGPGNTFSANGVTTPRDLSVGPGDDDGASEAGGSEAAFPPNSGLIFALGHNGA